MMRCGEKDGMESFRISPSIRFRDRAREVAGRSAKEQSPEGVPNASVLPIGQGVGCRGGCSVPWECRVQTTGMLPVE